MSLTLLTDHFATNYKGTHIYLALNSERAALLPARQVEVEVRAGLLAVCPMVLPDTDLTMRKNWVPTKIQSRYLELIAQLV